MTSFEKHGLRPLNQKRIESGFLKPIAIATTRPATVEHDDSDLDANGNMVVEKINRTPIRFS